MRPGDLRAAFAEALAALDPARLVAEALPPRPPKRARVVAVAAGKAAAAMARGALTRWGDRLDHALVVTVPPLPDPATITASIDRVDRVDRVDLLASSHPLPTGESVAAAEAALALAGSLGPSDLLLALISGGASALLAAPPPGMSLADKRSLTRALLDRGASIREVNLVRRHASRIKGGRLARAAGGARVLSLIVSDVVGGSPHDVGSGPSVPDPTTLAEARAALDRAGLDAPLTESVKPGDVRARAHILADPSSLAREVAAALTRRGLSATVDDPDEGDALTVARRRAARARSLAPGEAAVIACEPVLSLPASRGRGGRAGYVALAAMRDLPDHTTLLCAASDGIDGSSGGAGAIVTRADVDRIGSTAIDAALAAFDDASIHRALGTQLEGGPTGHNLTDVHVIARFS